MIIKKSRRLSYLLSIIGVENIFSLNQSFTKHDFNVSMSNIKDCHSPKQERNGSVEPPDFLFAITGKGQLIWRRFYIFLRLPIMMKCKTYHK